jgi:hypothetical protein
VLGRSQRSSGGSLLGPNIAPDCRRLAALRWRTCNGTTLRPCQNRVVGGALDALPGKAGSVSRGNPALCRHFPLRISITSSSRNATPRCCVHFVWLSTRRSCETAIYSRPKIPATGAGASFLVSEAHDAHIWVELARRVARAGKAKPRSWARRLNGLHK